MKKSKSSKATLLKTKAKYPKVVINSNADFASIKIADGIEKKSYLKKGILFSEDEEGRIIEIQILNLSSLALSKAS